MKKLMSLILTLMLLTAGLALAETPTPTEETWTESVTCRGDGIFIIDFIKDIPWRTEYLLTLTSVRTDTAENTTTTEIQTDHRDDAPMNSAPSRFFYVLFLS